MDNAVLAKNIRGLGLLSRENQGEEPFYYLQDAHGDVTKLLDASANVIQDYRYDVYGNEEKEEIAPQNAFGGTPAAELWITEVEESNNPYRYCGEYLDAETGNYYLRARYYDPEVERFTSEDPAKDGVNWYIYCNNNPVILIDFTGLKPTVREAAEMADHIYDHNTSNTQKQRKIIVDGVDTGWRLIDVRYGSEGMKMGIYVKTDATHDWRNPLEYALVFKGTTPTNMNDWQNNAEQFLNDSSTDMWDAINAGEGFVHLRSSYEITFVGHSKGGAEAAGAALTTNRNAITFNPAANNLEDYGLSTDGYTASMIAYIVKGEILNHLEGLFSKPIDQVVYLPQQYGGHWYEAGQTSLVQRIKNHLMGAVKSALKEAGY